MVLLGRWVEVVQDVQVVQEDDDFDYGVTCVLGSWERVGELLER